MGVGGYDRYPLEDTFTYISKLAMTRSDDDCTPCSCFQLRNLHLDNQDISEVMSGGARTMLKEDRMVAEKVRPGIKHGKTPDIDLGLGADSYQFLPMLDRAIEGENTRERFIGAMT